MDQTIRLEHGSGGVLSRQLVEKIIFPHLQSSAYTALHDAATITLHRAGELCMTTDSYVIDPPLFPGGNIGKLAVCGTCNDLAVSGAKPAYLTLAFILEQGFSIEQLVKIVKSVRQAANEVGAGIVTGDTKVVPQGKGGGIYINTAGVGVKEFSHSLDPARIKQGDKVIVSNAVGAHGIAVMAARENLPVGGTIMSDCAHLYEGCRQLYGFGQELKFLRDATRGGLSAVLNEIVSDQMFSISLEEDAIPVDPDVKGVSDILGLNPLEVANEGVFIAVLSPGKAQEAVRLLQKEAASKEAAVIGTVTEEHRGKVIMETSIGGKRILDFPRGLLLPRIC